MRRCEDEKMRYRPPLLEEPCAQTLSGKTMWVNWALKLHTTPATLYLNQVSAEHYVLKTPMRGPWPPGLGKCLGI